MSGGCVLVFTVCLTTPFRPHRSRATFLIVHGPAPILSCLSAASTKYVCLLYLLFFALILTKLDLITFLYTSRLVVLLCVAYPGMQDAIASSSQTISSPNFESCSNFTAATRREDADLTEGSMYNCLQVEPGHALPSTSDLDFKHTTPQCGFDKDDQALSMVEDISILDNIFPPSPPHSDPSYKRHIPLPLNHRSSCHSADPSYWTGPMWDTCFADASIGESHQGLPMDQDGKTAVKGLLELKLLPSPPLSPDGNSDSLPTSNSETRPSIVYEYGADTGLWTQKEANNADDVMSLVQNLGMLELDEANAQNVCMTSSPEPMNLRELPPDDSLVDSTQPSHDATMPRGIFYSPPFLPLEPLGESFRSLLTEEPLSVYDSHNSSPMMDMPPGKIFSDRKLVSSPEAGYSPDLIDDYIHGVENVDGLDRENGLLSMAPCSPSRRVFCPLPELDDTNFSNGEPQDHAMNGLSPPSTPRLSKLSLFDDFQNDSPFLSLDADTDRRDYNQDSLGILGPSSMFRFDNATSSHYTNPQFSPPSPSLSASSSRSSFSCPSPLTSPTSPTSPIDPSEELRLRTIYSLSINTQRECKDREAVITDYIKCLNNDLSFLTSSPFSRDGGSSSSSTLGSWSQAPTFEGLSLLGPSEGELSPLFLYSYEDNDPSESIQMKIQQATAARAELRKKRKEEKERSRELAALLKFKTGSINGEEAIRSEASRYPQSSMSQDAFEPSTPGDVPLSDVPMSGPGFGQDGMIAEGGLLLIHSPPTAPTALTPDASHLVAKMIMRRQSMAVRPLSKGTKEKEQAYTPSLLSGDSPRDKFSNNVRKSKSLTNGIFR